MLTLRLAFSPDSDDLFMFLPLLRGKISSNSYRFEHVRRDTQSLNELARQGELDVVAISIANYPTVAEHYLLLPHGGSVGRGYGPVVVATSPRTLGSLEGMRIGVPGLGTTGYLVLRLLLPSFAPVVVPIEPYARAFEALRAGEVDATLLIHEGRLTYEKEGMHRVLELGEGWSARTGGLPLPLGGNVIRRGLGAQVIADVSNLLRASIDYALQHREEMMNELLSQETRQDVGIQRALLDRYLGMYANADTLCYPEDCRRAIDELFRQGARAGLLAPDAKAEWAP